LASRNHLENLRVVLVSSRNPLNIGAAARAMSNFGVTDLRLVNPYEPSFREAKSAVGAAKILLDAQEFKTIPEAVADCSLVIATTAAQNRELQQPLRPLPVAARLIRTRLKSGKVAVLFGSEKHGLTNDDISHCHWVMHIPTRTEHLSMNLGQAVAVCIYEIARDVKIAEKLKPRSAATAAELDRLTAALLDALTVSGYLWQAADGVVEDKLRRLVRRLKFSPEDAELLLGMARKIVWKLHSKD